MVLIKRSIVKDRQDCHIYSSYRISIYPLLGHQETRHLKTLAFAKDMNGKRRLNRGTSEMQSPKIEKTGRNLLTIRIDRSITDHIYRSISHEIEKMTAAVGKIKLILVVEHYPSVLSAEDLFEDLRFLTHYSDSISKVAMVSDKSWKRTLTGLFSLFSRVNMQFFEVDQAHLASNWVQAE